MPDPFNLLEVQSVGRDVQLLESDYCKPVMHTLRSISVNSSLVDSVNEYGSVLQTSAHYSSSPENSSIVPRGMSFASELIPSLPTRSKIFLRPHKDACKLFHGKSSWSAVELRRMEMNAASIVRSNQEKLRDFSSKQDSRHIEGACEESKGCDRDSDFCSRMAYLLRTVRAFNDNDTSTRECTLLSGFSVLPAVNNNASVQDKLKNFSSQNCTDGIRWVGELLPAPNLQGIAEYHPQPPDEHTSVLSDQAHEYTPSVELDSPTVGDVHRFTLDDLLAADDADLVDSTHMNPEQNQTTGRNADSIYCIEREEFSFITEYDERKELADRSPLTGTLFASGSFVDQSGEVVDNDSNNDIDSLLNVPMDEKNINSLQRNTSKLPSSSPTDQWASTTPLPEAEYETLRPHMAMSFPFELDYFQKQAVMRLERRECVFVAAHTSAGKTVVAEYAIAMAKAHMSRTIYTSPIKALSNQKYRDFRDRFEDVGLITGDVSVNPDASCLIMTTEILRSMLYRGSDTIRDIEWVIFDEVHYVNDSERGVVWEEVIIMLPDRINLIFLSATTPNTLEFSDWIGRTKQRKIYVVSTLTRPVPLQHYMYYDDDMYCLMSSENHFNASSVSQAVQKQRNKMKPKEKSAENAAAYSQRQAEKTAIAMQASGGRGGKLSGRHGGGRGGRGGGSSQQRSVSVGNIAGGKGQWLNLLRILRQGGRERSGGHDAIDFGVGFAAGMKSTEAREEISHMTKYDQLPTEIRSQITRKEYESLEVRGSDDESDGGGLLPVVIFCFSKKKCEEIVDFFKGQDLIGAREKAEVRKIMSKVISRLNPLDARLPQVVRMEEMLLRGFGVHHGGLLPVLKESVELLFSKTIVKVLLATETFAMGVNMPARSVVFNGFRKHDGTGFRDLLPGEYTQMAGRAGRRGKDSVGIVIVAAWTDIPNEVALKTLLTGTATKLSSQFRLTYNMILNLLRANDLSVEDMIKRSFSEFHMQRAISIGEVTKKLKKYEKVLADLTAMQLEQSASSDNATVDDTVTPIYLDVELFHESLYRAQHHCLSLLEHVLESRGINELKKILCPGRVVIVQRTDMNEVEHICVGMLVADDSGSALSDMKSSSDPDSMSSDLKGARAQITKALSAESKAIKLDNVSLYVLLFNPEQCAETDPCAMNPEYFCVDKISCRHISLFLRSKVHLPLKFSQLNDIGVNISFVFNDMSKSSTSKTALGDSTSRLPVRSDDFYMGARPMKTTNKVPTKNNTENRKLFNNVVDSFNHVIADNFLFGQGVAHSVLDISLEVGIRDINFAETQADMTSAAVTALKCKYWRRHLENMLQRDADGLRAYIKEDGFVEVYSRQAKIHRLKTKMAALKYYSSSASLSLFPDFQQRLKVLQHLGYVDKENGRTVTLKGRVACEISTCDELLATEMLFFNVLEPLNPPEVAALLAALVFQEKNNDDCALTSRLEFAREQALNISKSLQLIQEQYHLDVKLGKSGGDSATGLNFGLSAVVYEWARGVPFKDITDMTVTHEGSIVRTITRLDELCKDFRNAARVVGNPSLYRKMEATSQCIKRDIVFAASLYIA